MDANNRGKRSKPKDAAAGTPMKGEDTGKERVEDVDEKGARVEEEAIGIKIKIKVELNDLRSDLSEIKGLLKSASEGKATEDTKVAELGVEPKDEGDNQQPTGAGATKPSSAQSEFQKGTR